MDFLKNLDLKPESILKVIGFGLLALIGVTFMVSLIGSSLSSLSSQMGGGFGVAPMMGDDTGVMYAETSSQSYTKGYPATLSVRNVNSMYPQPSGTVGSDAENFEVRDYTVSFETNDRDETCGAVLQLKSYSYAIFENANESERSCNYTFKVEHAHVAEVLTLLKNLNPRDLSENTYTIKRQLDDFTSEMSILEKKRATIDDTLKSALQAYDDITALATKTQNVESLAKIIDSKIQIIERLTQERLNINDQLDRLTRAKAEQLDRLDYSYFYVSVYENRYVDTESLKDSWREAIQTFVRDVNQSIQNATIHLIALVVMAIPYLIYLFILLVVAKYGWRAARKIWES